MTAEPTGAVVTDRDLAVVEGRRTFRGYVRFDATAEVVDLTLRPLGPREIVIRTEAVQACYTFANWIFTDKNQEQAYVPGHGGVGHVVAVGTHVRRFELGDRALAAITPQCGQCFHCLRGRADMCNFTSNDEVNGFNCPVFAAMDSGREVTGGRGGCSEYMIVNEEWATPLFTDLPASPLSLLSCVGPTGLAPATLTIPVRPGSDVVVFGLGPVGLSMVNGAAIMGAGRIIGVDPVADRRSVAIELGATDVVDPTGRDDTLVSELREMCKGRTDRFHAGGRAWHPQIGSELNPGPPTVNARGPEYIFEAVGGERMRPAAEPSPDPTGILPLQQAFELCPSYGTLVTTGVGQQGNVSFRAADFTNKGRTIHSAQYGRSNLMRDTPSYVRLMERGLYRAELIATADFPLDRAREAFEAAALRTTVSAQIVF